MKSVSQSDSPVSHLRTTRTASHFPPFRSLTTSIHQKEKEKTETKIFYSVVVWFDPEETIQKRQVKMEGKELRRKRKEEAKLLKRKRIEDAGGIRPRSKGGEDQNVVKETKNESSTTQEDRPAKVGSFNNKRNDSKTRNTSSNSNIINKKGPRQSNAPRGKHRFGRVMERVPCRNKPRFSTLSIALPGSVVSNCQTRELKTQLVGQIARAAAVYHVDEIIVFDDKLSTERPDRAYYSSRHNRDRRNEDDKSKKDNTNEQEHDQPRKRSDPHTFMARVLQYCECPQYLRRFFFPMHPDLQFAGLLSPIDAPHHVRAEESSRYREGVVLDKQGAKGSLVNCGIRGRPVEIDKVLTPGIRCTVKLDPKVYGSPGKIHGTVVSPSAPREENGTYCGYSTRLADSINAVFDECPFEGGYDLKIGTSERGDQSVDDKSFSLPSYRHALVLFGGVAGIEECVDADESMKIAGSESRKLFDQWVNICPFQGSRTIRTEEAVLISLARLSPFVARNTEKAANFVSSTAKEADVEFSDDSPSDESSDDNDDDSSSSE